MATDTAKCEICGVETQKETLKKCHGCDKMYCPACQSESTNQDYCKECVGMKGVVPH
ncbi:MAG: hypothetical protein ABFS19_10485 [Thermodesulfobacteriota bacterium]